MVPGPTILATGWSSDGTWFNHFNNLMVYSTLVRGSDISDHFTSCWSTGGLWFNHFSSLLVYSWSMAQPFHQPAGYGGHWFNNFTNLRVYCTLAQPLHQPAGLLMVRCSAIFKPFHQPSGLLLVPWVSHFSSLMVYSTHGPGYNKKK